MTNLQLRALLVSGASLPALWGGSALAQAPAQPSAVSEIIVTARRVEERLQDVPISISVVNQERLTKANIVSAEDLTRVVPSLNVQSRFSSEQTAFSIRGFSQAAGTSAAVGVYFAEVVAPRAGSVSLQGGDGAGPGSFFDLQNVQVLKGPQGTLFGRNTTGGAVLLVPRKPVDRFEGYVEGSLGNYALKRVQAVVNLPMAPWARVRLGVDRETRDGYMHNVSGIGPKDFADVDYVAARASLVLDLPSNIENYTILSYSRSDNNGAPGQDFRANPAISFGVLLTPEINRLNASGDPWQIEQKLINPRVLTKQVQVINTTTWRASESVTLKNIMSYSRYTQDMRQDVYTSAVLVPAQQAYLATPFAFSPDGYHTNDQKNFTEELQLQGVASDGRLHYQTGLYYEHSTPGDPIASAAPSLGATCLISGFTTLDNSRCLSGGRAGFTTGTIEFINMAAYAQATYALTDRLKATAGVRYTYDRARGAANSFNLTYVGPAGQFVAPTVTGCAAGFLTSSCVFSARTSSRRPTWTLNLQYTPTDDLMVYGTYSRGYRQGAVTPTTASGIPVFGPEKLDDYEVGGKITLHGPVSGNLNLAAFYSDLTDQQLQVALQSVSGQNAASILNGGKSRIYGLEFDGSLRFTDVFRVDGSLAYVNSKLQSINLPASFPGFNVVLPSALAGDPLAFTPKWGWNLGGTFTLPTDESLGRIELSAVYRYTSAWATSASNTTTFRSTPVKQVDLNLDWREVAGHPVDVSVFATNVTNQFTQGVVRAFYTSLGYDVRYIGQPRMYGVRVKARFGR